MMEHIEWTEWALIETAPGKRGGKPVIKGTRLRPEDLLVNREQGIEWLVENHGGITPDMVRAVLDFYDRHEKARVPHLTRSRAVGGLSKDEIDGMTACRMSAAHDDLNILLTTLKGPERPPARNLYERICARFEPLGGADDIELPPRHPIAPSRRA